MEARKEKRIKEEHRVVIDIARGGGKGETLPINAFTKDISLSGARIWTDKPFSLNSKLKLVLYLSRSKQIIRCLAIVKWIKNCDEGMYEIGVEFKHEMPDSLIGLLTHLYGRDQSIPTSVNTAGMT